MAFQTFRISPLHSLLCKEMATIQNKLATYVRWPLWGGRFDWSVKSEIQESSDRGPMCPVEDTQPCGKKALGLPVAFSVHLLKKMVSLYLMHGSTLLLCVKQTCVSKIGQVSERTPEAPSPGGLQTAPPPCVHGCELQVIVLSKVGLWTISFTFDSQNGL